MYDLGTKPHEIAGILKLPVHEVDDLIDDYESALNKAEHEYNNHEVPKVQEALREMKLEVPESERYEMRRRYLLAELQELKNDKNNPRLKKIMLEVKIFTGKLQGINPEMIVQARQYPITELVKSRRGMALCPFHNEKTPSMDIRKNFYHCYSCGVSGDVIDFVMKRDGLTFNQAVHRLV